MRFTTRSRYGTRIILDIALNGQDGPVRNKEISSRQGISIKYLEKLIYSLKKAHFITSKRGPRGGHSLSRSLDEITVGEVVRALDGDAALNEFLEEKDEDCANDALCLTRRIWRDASRAMFDKLDSISFSDLVKEAKSCSRKPCCLKNRLECS